MEVTETNFKETLPKIEETIKNCTFLSIDCEFSGLNTVSEINAFDTPQQYYEKVRKNCKDFLIIQFGISAFRFDPESDIFKQQSYNFYIFRRPVNRNIPDQRFLCQTSSINFLITQGFDFNKLFKSGISYLNNSEEEKYRENLKEKQKLKGQQNQNSDIIPIPENHQDFIIDIVKQIREFLKKNDSEELKLPKCNAFVRRLIYQTVAQKFSNKIVLKLEKSTDSNKSLIATKFKSLKEQRELEQKQFEEELTFLEDFVGFSKVIRIIIDSGKLVVGHNMCLDFFHTIDKFLTPLSQDYDDFKECAHSLFPKILDTKFLANADSLKENITSTVLADLLKTLSKEPFSLPSVEIEEDGQGYCLEDAKDHEAGFDSYMTGICFLSMWKQLGVLKNVKVDAEIFKDLTLLEPYINKIYLMILRDSQYIHLGGEDPKPNRDHVFYLTFPKTWKSSNIIDLFSPFGNVYVTWINETSAYVGLYKKEQAPVALSTLSQSDTYSIMPFSERQSSIKEARSRKIEQTPASSLNNSKRGDTFAPRPSKRIKTSDNDFSFENVESEAIAPPQSLAKKEKTFMETDAWD